MNETSKWSGKFQLSCQSKSAKRNLNFSVIKNRAVVLLNAYTKSVCCPRNWCIDRFKKFARLGTSLLANDAIASISATMWGKRASDALAKLIYHFKDANPYYTNSTIARIFSISEPTLRGILKRGIKRSDRQKKVKLGRKFVLTKRIKRQMGIDEVFLMMTPSMGIEIFGQKNSFDLAMFKIRWWPHRWESKFSVKKTRSTWPCSKFQQKSCHLSFSFSLFKLCLGFRGCPNNLFGNEVIHSYPYYLSFFVKNRILLTFRGKNTKFFYINTYFQSQISAYFKYFVFLQADRFLSNGSSIPSHFHADNSNFDRFFNLFFKQFKGKAPK